MFGGGSGPRLPLAVGSGNTGSSSRGSSLLSRLQPLLNTARPESSSLESPSRTRTLPGQLLQVPSTSRDPRIARLEVPSTPPLPAQQPPPAPASPQQGPSGCNTNQQPGDPFSIPVEEGEVPISYHTNAYGPQGLSLAQLHAVPEVNISSYARFSKF